MLETVICLHDWTCCHPGRLCVDISFNCMRSMLFQCLCMESSRLDVRSTREQTGPQRPIRLARTKYA